jgi:hypothetical protein
VVARQQLRRSPRVLVALRVAPPLLLAVRRLRPIVLRYVLDNQPTTLGAAKAAFENNAIRLIFVGARFDESRMFDLLDYIRKDLQHRKIPIVAAIVAPTIMSAETIAGLARTTKILGASVFVNLNDFADEETENTRIRIIVDALLVPPEVIPSVAESLSGKPKGN